VIAWKNLKLGKYKAVVIGFIAFIVLVGFCNWEKFKYNPAWAGETEYFLGLKQFEAGNYAKARGYFLTALEYNPDNPILLKYLGYIDAATGNELQALVWYEKLLAHDKSDRIIYLNRGIILSNMGRYKEAEQNYKEAMELFPDWDVPPKKLEELTPFLKRK
jgi:tetratricopeptide (TPR) repeat protein